jgi:hypothetical protein
MKKLLLALALLYATPTAAQTPVWLCNPSPSGCTPAGTWSVSGTVVGAGTGTTGAVTATLAAAASKTTYICGVQVSSTGTGTSPVTVTPLAAGSGTFTYQLTAPGNFSMSYSPCIPANAQNTAITVTAGANGTATAVDVNAWGYQQ